MKTIWKSISSKGSTIRHGLVALGLLGLLPLPAKSQQFNVIPSSRVDFSNIYVSSRYVRSLEAFEISDFVTIGQYVRFLSSLSPEDSLAHLPDRDVFSKTVWEEVSSREEWVSEPIAGISFSNVLDYCQWLTESSGDGSVYRPPMPSEWWAAFEFYEAAGMAHDMNQFIADWTFATNEIRSIHHSIDNTEADPYPDELMGFPGHADVLQSYWVMGNSFQIQETQTDEFFLYNYLEDRGYAHVGFRLVRDASPSLGSPRGGDRWGGTEGATFSEKCLDHWGLEDRSPPMVAMGLDLGEMGRALWHQKGGRLHGIYESWYPNGRLRAVGKFVDGQRSGRWIFQDSLGNHLRQYEYENNYACAPVGLESPYLRLLASSTKGEFPRKENGANAYLPDRPIDIAPRGEWVFTLDILKAENPALPSRRLFDDFLGMLSEKAPERLPDSTDFGTQFHDFPEVGFRVKYYGFFNLRTQVADAIPRDIAFLFEGEEGLVASPLFFYFSQFPSAWELLTKERLSQGLAGHIANLDDFFYFKEFAANVHESDFEHATWAELRVRLLELEHGMIVYGIDSWVERL